MIDLCDDLILLMVNLYKSVTPYLFLQKKGVNNIKTVNSSSLPINIKKAHHHFPSTGNPAKLSTSDQAP